MSAIDFFMGSALRGGAVLLKTLEITFFLVEKQMKLKYVFYEPRSSSYMSMLILI